MKLRPYQLDCLESIELKLQEGVNKQLVVLPTGAGKTVIFAELLKRKNLKTLVIAHRIELLQQAQDKITVVAPDIETGIFSGNSKCHDKQVTIATIQSAQHHLKLLKKEDYQLLIIDEAHHAAAKTYKELIRNLGFDKKDSKRLLVGFTATPYRGDGRALNDVFQQLVYHISIRKLVNLGYLVKPEGIHVKVGIDLRQVKKQLGDYRKDQLKRVMLEKESLQVVLATIKTQAPKRRGIVFTVNIEHAEIMKKCLIQEGFSCATVHSKVSKKKREKALKDFSSGKAQFITNPMILTEGFDCPAADCMINAAPTMNRSLYIQRAGRVLRPFQNKTNALLIDFGYTKNKHALRTVVDMFGDSKLRKISKAHKLMSRSGKDNFDKEEEVKFKNLRFEESEKEKYDPLDPEKTGGINHKWIRDKNEKRTVFFITEGDTRIFLVQYHNKKDGWNLHRYRKSSITRECEKEYFGVYEKRKAFEIGESLIEEVLHQEYVKKLKGKATEKQLNYLKVLMIKTNVKPNFNPETLSKKKAKKYINHLKSMNGSVISTV